MKTYTIATDPNTKVILSEIDIRNLIKNNPELLTPTPTHKRKYFVPKDAENFFYIDNTYHEVRESKYNMFNTFCTFCVSTGNCFATEQDAQDELNRRQSLVRIWNNYDDKYSWDIDWEDDCQYKYEITYNHRTKKIAGETMSTVIATTELPYFKSAEDRNQFVEDNRDDLLTIFNIKK